MNSEAFLSLYLKEIGVQTPVSSFLLGQEKSGSEEVLPEAELNATSYVAEKVQTMQQDVKEPRIHEVAEPEPVQQQVAVQAEPSVQPIENEPVSAETIGIHPDIQEDEEVTDLIGLQRQAEACKACELVDSRNHLVFGSGYPRADLVFIGDSPSRDEDIEGKPFIGRSGELFDRMLASVQLNRDDIYLMNGVKCRPQHGRDPKPDEFSSCERWLVSQLDMLQPRLICMLGRVVAEALLKTEASLAELRAGQFSFRGIPVLVIDHPSYLLRSQKHKQRAWEDLNRLKDTYQKLQTA